ncbi:hypothetical protein Bca52824_023651 [Brassica carinata]|uniref:DUF4283 domain-containing protein n=1 Tax=Brassica carinata TaxID=52824 RepID=A0A8X7VIV9_BRACI|nr:hypothetical protein Bca52824_023651 [Brassica carinata]
MTAPEQGVSSPEKEMMKKGEMESNLIGEKDELEVAVTAKVDGVNMVKVSPIVADLSSGSGAPLWEDCLLGKFLDKAPHVGAIHATVKRILSLGDKDIKVKVYVINDYTVKFWISDAKVRARVLRQGIWNIKNIPMIVSKWSPIVEDVHTELKTIHFWVVLKNVPRTMFSWNGLSSLTSPFGEPKNFMLKHFGIATLKRQRWSLVVNESGNAQPGKKDLADIDTGKSQVKMMSVESRSKENLEPKSLATPANAKRSGSVYEGSKEWSKVSPGKAAKQPVKKTVVEEIFSSSHFTFISAEDGFDDGDDEEVNCDEEYLEEDKVESQMANRVEDKIQKLSKQREIHGTVTRASARASQSLHTAGTSGSNSPGLDSSQKSLSNKKTSNKKKDRSKKHHH